MSNNELVEVRGGRMRFAPGTVLQLVIYVLTLAALHNSLNERIVKLEVQQQRLERDIAEIKADLKILIQAIK